MAIDERTYLRACLIAGGRKEQEVDAELEEIFGPGQFDSEQFKTLSLSMRRDILERTSLPEVVEGLNRIISGASHRGEYLAAAIAASALVNLITSKYPNRGDD
ncbi:Uncharacterised protein [Klebsiella pneumoniae]|uniref:hypothetical protein n=1 Tax=Klebsiella pneumoniae complex TaxID=3390273 RepID=UPI000C79D081|nr:MULTISPECIES: hypothetical protein [Klebsiella]EKX2822544.1 hypothetical protein [Klebsiella pneumoniae]ELC9131899.1 hypothetical protein [Klebsiella pneumoniae]PLJ40726.1 hypothetical protein B6J67_18740 [Klebsiella quasipneumoniae]PLJ61393.1 hypothetical protein B6J68_15965 [Klebsiella quasipneumoniae]ROG13108.1 hypothetical protein C4Y62_026455 [Klebsiella pneumoniae subsp. pneumoniae]